MSRIVVPGGQSQVPTDVQNRVRAIDPDLFLRPTVQGYIDAGANGDDYKQTTVWQLCLKWGQNDPRRERVKRGEYPEEAACDLLCVIPADCPLDQVPGYIAKHLNRGLSPRHVFDGIAQWNQDQSLRNGSLVTDFAAELFKQNRDTIAGQPKSKHYQYKPGRPAKTNASPE